MHESTLSVWMVILITGAFVNFLLGALSPFLTKDDKKRIKEFCKIPHEDDRVLVVKLKYRFAWDVYIVIAMLAGLVALIFFFIEDFLAYAGAIGGSITGYVLVVVVAIFTVLVLECIIAIIAFIIEQNMISSIVKYCNRCGVEIEVNDDCDETLDNWV